MSRSPKIRYQFHINRKDRKRPNGAFYRQNQAILKNLIKQRSMLTSQLLGFLECPRGTKEVHHEQDINFLKRQFGRSIGGCPDFDNPKPIANKALNKEARGQSC